MKVKTTIITVVITALITFVFTYNLLDKTKTIPTDNNEEPVRTYDFVECHYCGDFVPNDYIFEDGDDLVCPDCVYGGLREIIDKDTGKCYQCGNFYDHTWSYGLGLCQDCGKTTVSECAFCFKTTFAWGPKHYFAVCPDCMGEALDKTDIQEYLCEFNESR